MIHLWMVSVLLKRKCICQMNTSINVTWSQLIDSGGYLSIPADCLPVLSIIDSKISIMSSTIGTIGGGLSFFHF